MRQWIRALMLMLASSMAQPSAASILSTSFYPWPAPIVPPSAAIYTGADGALAPAADYTLPYRADGMFDFTAIDLGTGITLRFDAQMQNVKLISLGDILIAGTIDARGANLTLETPGNLLLANTGSILADSISISGMSLSLWGAIDTLSGNPTHGTPATELSGGLYPFPGGIPVFPTGPGTISLVVPEPATPWLVATLLPLLMQLGRKRLLHRR